MPNTLLEYQLRIRNASTVANPNGTADALTITSVPTGTNPYIAAPPSGDGQELDPVTGAVRTGAYVVEVADAATGTDGTGTIRVVTNALEDATALQQLLGRRAFVEYRANGGAWQPLQTGYILNVRLVSPVRWAITVGDTRRVERTQPIFSGASLGSYATRGCLTGGPVTADFGPVKARGGWKYRLTNDGSAMWRATFVEGYLPANQSTPTRDWRTLQNPDVNQVIAGYARANPYAILTGQNYVAAYGQLSRTTPLEVLDGIVVYAGTTPANATLQSALLVSTAFTNAEFLGYAALDLYWPFCPFPSNSDIYVSLSTAKVSNECPLYIQAHPVDVVTAIWSAARIQYDTSGAWIAATKALIGEQVRVSLKLTEAPTIERFLEDAILGPFGLAIRTTTAGNQELVSTRLATTATPTLTIAAADLASADPVVFELDERTAISSLTLNQTALAPVLFQYGLSAKQSPTDGLIATEVSITGKYVDPAYTTFAARDVSFTVPGMIHTASDFAPTPEETLAAIAGTMLPRFGRGVAAAEVQVLASAASAAAQVGDEVYLAAPHYPNRNYRIGESTVGARIMQVVRRTDTPTGPLLRLLDSGLAAQPVSPAATITAAKNPSNPTLVARFTITNAGTINAGNTIGVEVEWATGASAPTGNGTTFAIYEPSDVPTAAVDLPGLLTSGQTVHVRARTTQFQRRPSAWTAWQSVTLDTIPTPGAITATAVSATATDIAWANTSNDYPIAVFAYLGSSAPANWAPYFVGELPAGSTATTIRTLSAGTWQLAIAYDAAGSFGPFRTGSVTTTGSGAAATRPAGLVAIDLLDDVSLRQGVALGLFPSDQTLDIVVERAFLLAGPYVEVGRVNGATESIVDILPRDGQTYFYRTRHALGGYATSAATPVVSAVARGVPPTVNRPPARVPTVQVGVSETSTTGTVSLAISDTQGRFMQARFRHRTNGGAWSAWTVATATPTTNPSGTINGYTASYAASLPATGFLDIEYEVTAFGADGVVAVIAGGVESFDVGVSADFVSVVGTFGVNGDFVLALSADTDTQSFKLAFSTTAQPNLATTQAQGAINGRTYTTTFSGPYDVGTIIYVSALGYTGAGGTGTESVLFEYQFQRGASNIQCLATETISTNTQSTVSVAALSATGAPISGAQVQLVALDGPTVGKATIASGAAIGAWVTAPGTWVFNRGTPLSGSSVATFRARRSASLTNETDDDGFVIVEEGRDTKPVRSRARIITTTATQCVVRVAVNVPSPYTATTASITYVSQGVGTVSPGSGQAVTTGVGDFATPETAGSFVDFTVDRPAVGQPAGGVTFTATATGFAPDTDPIVIPPQSTTLALLGRARVLTTTATTVVVRVAVTSPVTLSPNTATIVYSEAGVTGTTPASGQTVTPTTGDFITEAAGAPLNYVDFTINRPAFAAGTGRVVFTATATDRAAAVAAIDVPAVERDTVPLLARARVTATSATSITVRVAVASPVALSPNTASIAYVEAGVTGTSPASPRTVTPQTGDTITEAAGSFEDFTITRPAFGAGAGRVTFQVTATGRVAAIASIDVPPQDKDFTPPAFSPTLTLAATTGQVTWPAVAGGVTVEGSTDNVTFTTATGTTYPAAATSRNAFGGATKFLFVRAYNAAGVYTPTYSFAVPPQDPAVPVITKVTAYTLTLNYSTDPTDPNTFQLDYTISNFPSGGSIEVSVLQDGVDIGIPVISSSSSTQTIVASPIVLNATGTTPVRWDIMFRVMDSTGINVEATSKVLDATSYV